VNYVKPYLVLSKSPSLTRSSPFIAGKKDQLVGKIQAKYGVTKEDAEKQIKEFSNDCHC
jgi:hypothetical protein